MVQLYMVQIPGQSQKCRPERCASFTEMMESCVFQESEGVLSGTSPKDQRKMPVTPDL